MVASTSNNASPRHSTRWLTRLLLLMALTFALSASTTAAAQPTVVAFGFTELESNESPTPTPTPKPPKTPKPKKSSPALTPTPTSVPSTAPIVDVTEAPTATTVLPPAATLEPLPPAPSSSAPPATPSPSSANNTSVTTVAPQPTVAPATPTPSSATPVATPVPSLHDCNATTVRLVTLFYDRNNLLEGSCAAVNDYYRFPFEGAPTRTQLLRMSTTSACTVLMQALLQLVAFECDFKRNVPLRSTAEAILQLARDRKAISGAAASTSAPGVTGSDAPRADDDDALLPSSDAIMQAIQTRRKELLTPPAAATDTTETTPAAASWSITAGITSVNDDGEHILMDKTLVVVGTFQDARTGSSSDSGNADVVQATMTPVPSVAGANETVPVDVASTTSDATTLRSVRSAMAALVIATSVFVWSN